MNTKEKVDRGSITKLMTRSAAEDMLKLVNMRIDQAEKIMKTIKEELDQLNAERRIYDAIVDYHDGIFLEEE